MKADQPRTLIALACAAFLAPALLLPFAWAEAQTDVWIKQDTGAHRILGLIWLPGREGALVSIKGAGLWLAPAAGAGSRSSEGMIFSLGQGLSVVALVSVPAERPAIAALTSAGTLYRSWDEGRHWEPVNAPDAAPAGEFLAATQGGTLVLIAGAQVYRSADVGTSWHKAGQLPTGAAPSCVAGDLPTAGALLVGTEDGRIVASRDGGETWEQSEMFLARGRVQAIAGAPAEGLYVGTASGLLRSDDQGKSWHLASEALQGQDVQALLIAAGRPATWYVGLGRGGVYRSADGGERWEALGRGLARRSLVALAFDPAGPALIAGAQDGVWRCQLSAAPVAETPLPPTATVTATPTATAGRPTATMTVMATASASPTPSPTLTQTLTATPRPTQTPTQTSAPTATFPPSPSPTQTSTLTVTPTPTQAPTREPPPPTKEATPPR